MYSIFFNTSLKLMFAVRVKIKIELNCIDPAPQLDKTSQYHC